MSARSAGFSLRDFRKPPPGEENFPYFYQGAYISGIFLLQNLVTFWGKKIKKIFFYKKTFFPKIFFSNFIFYCRTQSLFGTKKSKKYFFLKFFENFENVFSKIWKKFSNFFFLIKKKKEFFVKNFPCFYQGGLYQANSGSHIFLVCQTVVNSNSHFMIICTWDARRYKY